MDLHNFVLICLGLFAEIKDTVMGYSCPADFGGANFPVPWTTRKVDFVGESNFFTASLPLKRLCRNEGNAMFVILNGVKNLKKSTT